MAASAGKDACRFKLSVATAGVGQYETGMGACGLPESPYRDRARCINTATSSAAAAEPDITGDAVII